MKIDAGVAGEAVVRAGAVYLHGDLSVFSSLAFT
jgi:hypothetical protein